MTTFTAPQITALTAQITGQPLGRLATTAKTFSRFQRAFADRFGGNSFDVDIALEDVISGNFAAAQERLAALLDPTAPEDDTMTDEVDTTETETEAAAETAKPKRQRKAAAAREPKAPRDTKKAQLIAMLQREGGTTLDEVCAEFGWLQHTARSAITAGVGTKMGNVITSEKVDGVRRYSIVASESAVA